MGIMSVIAYVEVAYVAILEHSSSSQFPNIPLLRKIGGNSRGVWTPYGTPDNKTKTMASAFQNASRSILSFNCRSISALLRTSRAYTTTSFLKKKAWEPSIDEYKYWNREESKKGQASYVLDMSPESIQKEARILCLAADEDDANSPLTKGPLPFGGKLLKSEIIPQDFDDDSLKRQNPNVLFVSPSCPHARHQLPQILKLFPSIEWIHVRSAGIDFLESEELPSILETRPQLIMTNAKGQFSSSLAEYVMMACSYFAKDIPRLLRQKGARVWNDFDITELRGKTMGIVGYGDIG
jgi:hypothetical protein